MAGWASLHSDAWRGWKPDAVRAGEGELVCVCVDVDVHGVCTVACLCVCLGQPVHSPRCVPHPAHTNQLEESSLA